MLLDDKAHPIRRQGLLQLPGEGESPDLAALGVLVVDDDVTLARLLGVGKGELKAARAVLDEALRRHPDNPLRGGVPG